MEGTGWLYVSAGPRESRRICAQSVASVLQVSTLIVLVMVHVFCLEVYR